MNPITLPLAELKPALTGLGKVINRSATLPVLQSLRLERTPDGWVCLTGTDLDRFITVRMEQPSKGDPMALLVPYEDLLRIAKNCAKNESLQISPADKGSALIRFALGGDSGESRVSSLPVEEFPPIPRIKGSAIPLSESLRRSLHEAMACSGTDAARFVLNGAFLDASKPDAHYLVGTDGRHLYSSNSFKLPLKTPLIIPKHKFLGWRDFNLDGEWQLKTGQPEGMNHPCVQFSSRRWRYVSRLIDGTYPNWKQVVPDPRNVKTTLSMDPSAVETILRAVELLPCHDDTYRALGIECRDRQVHLLGKDKPEAPWVRTRVPQIKATGADVTVFLDRRLLIKALEFGLLTIGIIDELSPLRFSQGGRQMIVMPVRAAQGEPANPSPPQPASPPREPASRNSPAPVPEPPTPRPTMRNESPVPIPDPNPQAAPRFEDVLQLVDSLREVYAGGMAQLKDLSLKLRLLQRGHKTSEREMQSVRHTLRSLQSVRL
jgi:DNA polymerase III sliding clamp (beta) subunit (PCNA family)